MGFPLPGKLVHDLLNSSKFSGYEQKTDSLTKLHKWPQPSYEYNLCFLLKPCDSDLRCMYYLHQNLR